MLILSCDIIFTELRSIAQDKILRPFDRFHMICEVRPTMRKKDRLTA